MMNRSMPTPPSGVRTSFLLRGGHLINAAGHRDRLLAAGASSASMTDAFSALAQLAAISAPTLFFPQLLITDSGEIDLEPRPIPENRLTATVALITHPHPDARRSPQLKGPDFAYQTQVRDAAASAGADDAILLGPDGLVRETAFGTLCLVRALGCEQSPVLVVNASTDRLPSTTEAALIDAWQEGPTSSGAGQGEQLAWGAWEGAVLREPITEQDLHDADAVLLLSALHTLRTVTSIDGRPVGTRAARTLRDTFQKRLWDRADVLTA